MDDMIGGSFRDILGQDTEASWSECFTTVERLCKLFDQPGPSPVGIIAVTDHMNARSHRLPEPLLRLAAREPRLAACSEVTCVERDTDGAIRRCPEILLYGGPDPVAGPFGPHFGISQAIIDEIFRDCIDPVSGEVMAGQLIDFCRERHLAFAMAHPFDGHELSLEATFDLISRASFTETVNGGFPAVSTRILEDLIAFQNRIVLGFGLPPELALRFPVARRLAERIRRQGRGLLHPWGGSDAHSHNFDRVTMRFLAHRPDPTAGDLFRCMLERPVEQLLADGTFSICGQPGTAMSVLDDVSRIVVRNFWSIRPYIQTRPYAFARMVARTFKVVREELGRRDRRQAQMVADAEQRFDANALLQNLILPARIDLARPAASGVLERTLMTASRPM
ncbi:MAG: hypothetical protein JXR96_17135 [Deltaproteobacteria bacterium]|nr:hypothetical protein [Deltaproteobacteria bacterium]